MGEKSEKVGNFASEKSCKPLVLVGKWLWDEDRKSWEMVRNFADFRGVCGTPVIRVGPQWGLVWLSLVQGHMDIVVTMAGRYPPGPTEGRPKTMDSQSCGEDHLLCLYLGLVCNSDNY